MSLWVTTVNEPSNAIVSDRFTVHGGTGNTSIQTSYVTLELVSFYIQRTRQKNVAKGGCISCLLLLLLLLQCTILIADDAMTMVPAGGFIAC